MLKRALGVAVDDDGGLGERRACGGQARCRVPIRSLFCHRGRNGRRRLRSRSAANVGGGSSPAWATLGTATWILRSISSNFVATMKKMTSKNNTSIIDVRLSAGMLIVIGV